MTLLALDLRRLPRALQSQHVLEGILSCPVYKAGALALNLFLKYPARSLNNDGALASVLCSSFSVLT